MPFSTVAAIAGTAAAGASLANSLGGGGGASTTVPATFQPPNQGAAAGLYQQLQTQFGNTAYGVPGITLPGIRGATNNLVGNPYAAGQQQAANLAPSLANAGLSNDLFGAQSLFSSGGNILNTAFDPQQALYNRTAQQLTDQSNAINSMYGLGNSPAGAGLTDQTLTNFNIDWQNQQLQRQAQGLSAASGAFTQGGNLQNYGLKGYETFSALPSTVFQGNQNSIIQALNNYAGAVSGAFGPNQQAANELAAYLKLGQSASSIGQQGANLAFGQQQQNLSNLLGGLGTLQKSGAGSTLSNLFGGSGTTGYGSALMNSYGAGAKNPYAGQSAFPNYGLTRAVSGGAPSGYGGSAYG